MHDLCSGVHGKYMIHVSVVMSNATYDDYDCSKLETEAFSDCACIYIVGNR